MSIVRFNPFFDVERTAVPEGWVPVADVWETPAAFRIDIEIPAVAAQSVDVSVDEGILVISGERRQTERAEADRNHRLERHHGKFSRRFRLPESADVQAISARIESGVLEVTIAKLAELKPRRIEVIAA